MCFGPFRRVCHWGPLFALGIIKLVTLCTIHCSYLLWPRGGLTGSGNFWTFLLLSGLTLYCFLNALLLGPGYVPLGWRPDQPSDEKFLQFCVRCQGFKAPRAHHCSSCGRCVMKMDHHCPWINNCVGHRNHAYFLSFMLAAIAGCLQGLIICSLAIYRTLFLRGAVYMHPPQMSFYMLAACLLAIGLAMGVVIGLSGLSYFQIRSILRNRTGIEDWILEKAIYRRQMRFQTRHYHLMERQEKGEDVTEQLTGLHVETFDNPYDVGCANNWRLVMTTDCQPRGDGFTWPVRADSDQYTLTREQLQQKREKQDRIREFLVTESCSGSWLPITKGVRVVCSLPWSTEPRIRLQRGDRVLVSRYRKHWLYGERVVWSTETAAAVDGAVVPRVRGWFPRRGALEQQMVDTAAGDHSSTMRADKKHD